MGHDVKATLERYCSTAERFFRPLYTNTMEQDQFLHILRFLNFCDYINQPDKNENYHRLCKMRTVFDQFNDAHATF